MDIPGGQSGSLGSLSLQRVDATLGLRLLRGSHELRLLKLDLSRFGGLDTMINQRANGDNRGSKRPDDGDLDGIQAKHQPARRRRTPSAGAAPSTGLNGLACGAVSFSPSRVF